MHPVPRRRRAAGRVVVVREGRRPRRGLRPPRHRLGRRRRDPARRRPRAAGGQGVGSFVLARLEDEAAARGINYVYNTIRAARAVASWCTTGWSSAASAATLDGDLRKRVGSSPADPRRAPRAPDATTYDAAADEGGQAPGREEQGGYVDVDEHRRSAGRGGCAQSSRDAAGSRRDSPPHQRRRSGAVRGLGARPPGAWARRCQRSCRSVEDGGGAGPGPVVVEQLGRQVRVEEREAAPRLRPAAPGRRTPPRSVGASAISKSSTERDVAVLDVVEVPRRGEQTSCSSPMPAAGPVQAKARSREAEVADDAAHLVGLGRRRGRPRGRRSGEPRPSQVSRVRSRCRSCRWVSGIGTLSTSQRPSQRAPLAHEAVDALGALLQQLRRRAAVRLQQHPAAVPRPSSAAPRPRSGSAPGGRPSPRRRGPPSASSRVAVHTGAPRGCTNSPSTVSSRRAGARPSSRAGTRRRSDGRHGPWLTGHAVLASRTAVC